MKGHVNSYKWCLVWDQYRLWEARPDTGEEKETVGAALTPHTPPTLVLTPP